MAKEKLVYCRLCGAQIASGAKRCPRCGAKQKKGHFFRNLILLIIIVIIGSYGVREWKNNKQLQEVREIFKKNKSDTHIDASNDQDNEKTAKQEGTQKQTETVVSIEKEQTNAPEQIEAQDNNAEANIDTNGVSADFKEYMDSYESFMNEYCDFMETYDESNATALMKYASLMTKYAEFASKVETYNEDNLSAEDYKYYVDVMARVQKRLIDASVSVDG